MKVRILLSMTLVLVLLLTACAGQPAAQPTQQPAKPAGEQSATQPTQQPAKPAAEQPAKPAPEAAKPTAEAKAPTLEKVKYVDSGAVASYSVVWVGVAAGIFKKNGLDVELVTAQSTTSAIQSLLSGDVQMGNADTVGVLTANHKGANLATLMSYQRTILFELFVHKDIKTAQDLKGKKMGISRFGGTGDHMARLMLRKLGLDPEKDMTFVQIGSGAERTAALINNSIQATVVSPPEPVKLAREPSIHLLAKLSDLDVVYPYFSFITTRNYLKDHREVFSRFIKGYLESLQYYATHKQESMDVIGKTLRTDDKEALEYAWKTTVENSYMKPYVPKDASMIYEFAEADAKEPIKVKWEDTYDNSFVKELDQTGFIDKLFEGVKNVIREPVAHN